MNFQSDMVPASEARQVLLASMTEKEFGQAVVELAEALGWTDSKTNRCAII